MVDDSTDKHPKFRGQGQRPSSSTPAITAIGCEAEALEVVLDVLRNPGKGRSAGSTQLRAAQMIFEKAAAEREAGKGTKGQPGTSASGPVQLVDRAEANERLRILQAELRNGIAK